MLDLKGVKMIDRPGMYQQCLDATMQELVSNPNIKHVGPKASGQSYKDGIGRRRVRSLARTMARMEMCKIRKAVPDTGDEG